MTIKEHAQKMCDARRRKHAHLTFFIGDPPCAHCMKVARAKQAKS